MLDSEGFVAAGFVHDLKLHRFNAKDNTYRYVVMGKVSTSFLDRLF